MQLHGLQILVQPIQCLEHMQWHGLQVLDSLCSVLNTVAWLASTRQSMQCLEHSHMACKYQTVYAVSWTQSHGLQVLDSLCSVLNTVTWLASTRWSMQCLEHSHMACKYWTVYAVSWTQLFWRLVKCYLRDKMLSWSWVEPNCGCSARDACSMLLCWAKEVDLLGYRLQVDSLSLALTGGRHVGWITVHCYVCL